MFRRQNNQENQNAQNPDNAIRKEQDAEDSLLNIGNEAAGLMDDLPNLISNEANNSIDASDDSLTH